MINKRGLFVNELHRRWKIAVFLLVADAILSTCIGVMLHVTKETQASAVDVVAAFQIFYGLFVVAVLGISAFESREKDGTKFFLYQVPFSPMRVFWAKYLAGLLLMLGSILCIVLALIMLKGTSFLSDVMLPEINSVIPIIWCVYTTAFLVSPMIASDVSALGATFMGAVLAVCLFFSLTLKHPALVTLEETEFWRGSYWRIFFASDLLVTLMLLSVTILLFRRFQCLRLTFRQRAVVLMLLCTAASLWIFCNVFIDFHDLFYLLTTRTQVYVASKETQIEILRALAEKVDRYREERYGPSCYEKYLQILKVSERDEVSYDKLPSDFRGDDRYRLFSSTKEMKQEIEEYFRLREPWWEMLQESLACGSMYRPVIQILDDSQPRQYSYLTFQYLIHDLCGKALFEHSNTKGDLVLEYTLFALLLVSQCPFDDSLALLPRQFLRAILSGVSDILWRIPTPEYSAVVSEHIEAAIAEDKFAVPQALNTFVSMLADRQWTSLGVDIPMSKQDRLLVRIHENGSLLVCLLETLQKEPDRITYAPAVKWLERVDRVCGGVAEHVNDFGVVSLSLFPYSMRLTTSPTLEKRLVELFQYDSFFDEVSDPFELSDFKGLNPKVAAMVRFGNMLSLGYDFEMRLHNLHSVNNSSVDLVRIALASRRFYDVNGMYPSAVDDLIGPGLIGSVTNHFMKESKEHEIQIIDAMNSPAILNPRAFAAERVLIASMLDDFLTIDCRDDGVVLKGSAEKLKERSGRGGLPQQDWFSGWSDALATLDPWFGRPTYTEHPDPFDSMASFIVPVNIPRHFWWAYSPGPDGKDTGGYPVYDPTNGTMSQGDIGCFIGCEW